MEVEDTMRKISLILIFSLILTFTLSITIIGIRMYDADLDGYTNDQDVFPYDSTEWKDTDHDQVGDNADDFPKNPQLHEKCQFSSVENHVLKSKEMYNPPHCNCFNVSKKCKYIIVEWTISDTTSNIGTLSKTDKENIFLQLDNPSISLRRNYHYFISTQNKHTFTCNVCSPYDYGEWKMFFYNGLENNNVIMNCNIYRAR